MWRFAITNGITERSHTKMGMLSRGAYGFRKVENYRIRVLAQCGWNGVINRVQSMPIPSLWGRARTAPRNQPECARLPGFFLWCVCAPRSLLTRWPRTCVTVVPLGAAGAGVRLRSASVTIFVPMEIPLVWLRSLLFHIRTVYSWQPETGRRGGQQCLNLHGHYWTVRVMPKLLALIEQFE